jgi:CheY-like chemotaxis protein
VLLPSTAAPVTEDVQLPEIREDGRPVILVIDDDPAALQLVEDYLGRDAYQMVGTMQPAHALQLAEKLQPAVIITDIMMPFMDGWEVLRRMRASPRTAPLPVVVVSSSDRPEDIRRCYALGANSYLLKRFPSTYLADAARYWIEMNQVIREPEPHPW